MKLPEFIALAKNVESKKICARLSFPEIIPILFMRFFLHRCDSSEWILENQFGSHYLAVFPILKEYVGENCQFYLEFQENLWQLFDAFSQQCTMKRNVFSLIASISD